MQRPRRFHSKKEYVYETLREEILNGTLEPGSRLIIDDLATRLGVSPIPVREALQWLQSDGLVQIEPHVGVRVTEIHAGLIQEVFSLLEAMEVISSQAACQRMTDADFGTMEKLLRKMDENVTDLDGWSQGNVQLHQFICECAEMSLVHDLMFQVLAHWNRLRRQYLEEVIVHRVQCAQQEHWQILAAMRTRDPVQVAKIIHRHNQEALNDYLEYLTDSGQLEAETGAEDDQATVETKRIDRTEPKG